MHKKGLSVSINMIVILIIAILTLVVAVGFITGFFSDIIGRMPEPPSLQEPPTANNPITLNPKYLERGKQQALAIGFYNDEDETVAREVLPSFDCESLEDLSVSAMGLEVLVGDWNTYAAIVSVPRDTQRGLYSCILTISETTTSFPLEVR